MARHFVVRAGAVALVAWSAFGLTGLARGALVNNFLYVANPTANPTATDRTVTVAAGAAVRLDLYLQETIPAGNLNIIDGDDGLLSGGVTVFSPANGSSLITGWLPNDVDFGGPGVTKSGTTNGVTPSPAAPLHNFSFSAGVAPTAPDGVHEGNTGGGAVSVSAATASDVYLGSITIIAGSPGSTTAFAIGQYGADDGNTLTYFNPNDLDAPGNHTATLGASDPAGSQAYTGVGSQTTTFTVNVVPEPSGLGLLGVGAMLALRRRRA